MLPDEPRDDVLRLRVESSLKRALAEHCRRIDRQPSQIVRSLIRDYLTKHVQLEIDVTTDLKRGRK